MHRKLRWILVAGIVSVAAYAAGTVLATPPNGATALALAPVGQFPEIKAKAKIGDWKAGIKFVVDAQDGEIVVKSGELFSLN